MSKPKIKLAIVDDHSLFRKGLIGLLKSFDEFDIVFEATNGIDLLEYLLSAVPDIIMLDLEMPKMDGIETTKELKKKYPDIKIIVLSMHGEDAMIFHLIEQGANAFLQKNAEVEVVASAIKSVFKYGFYNDNKTFKIMVDGIATTRKLKPIFKELTLKEIEIIQLICFEYTNKEIAEKLCLSLKTVDNYREKILYKTNSKNAAGVVVYAIKYGLLNKDILLRK